MRTPAIPPLPQAKAHQSWRLGRQRRRAAEHTATAAAAAVAVVDAGRQPPPASARVLQRTSAVLRVPSLPRQEVAAGGSASHAAGEPEPETESGAGLASSKTIRGSRSAPGSFRHVVFTAPAASYSPFLAGRAPGRPAAKTLWGEGKGGPETGLAIAASGSARVLPTHAGSSGALAPPAPLTPHLE